MYDIATSDKVEKSRLTLYRLYIGLGYFYSLSVVALELWTVLIYPLFALAVAILTTSFENHHIKVQLKSKFGFSDHQVKTISNLNLILTMFNTLIILISSAFLIKEGVNYYISVFFPDITP